FRLCRCGFARLPAGLALRRLPARFSGKLLVEHLFGERIERRIDRNQRRLGRRRRMRLPGLSALRTEHAPPLRPDRRIGDLVTRAAMRTGNDDRQGFGRGHGPNHRKPALILLKSGSARRRPKSRPGGGGLDEGGCYDAFRLIRRETGLIEFASVGLRYGQGPEILRDLTFRIEPGTFHFLTGPSGSGKTSLLQLLLLSLKPSRGTLTMFGRNVSRLNQDSLLDMRRHIGIVFQE